VVYRASAELCGHSPSTGAYHDRYAAHTLGYSIHNFQGGSSTDAHHNRCADAAPSRDGMLVNYSHYTP